MSQTQSWPPTQFTSSSSGSCTYQSWLAKQTPPSSIQVFKRRRLTSMPLAAWFYLCWIMLRFFSSGIALLLMGMGAPWSCVGVSCAVLRWGWYGMVRHWRMIEV